MSSLVSVIIAVYNGAPYIESAIISILSQKYTNYEIIIIDGGSSDGTLDIINHYEKFIKYFISEKDDGIYDAWNKGIKQSKGEWITFIGSDDILYSNALETYINFILENSSRSELEFISSKIELVDKEQNLIKIVGQPWEWKFFKEKMITWHVGTFHSKKLFDKYGLFDTKYKISGDYELLLRPKNLLKAAYIPIVTVKMTDGGVSTKLLFKAIEETYSAKIKNGLIYKSLGPILIYIAKTKLYLKMSLTNIRFLKRYN